MSKKQCRRKVQHNLMCAAIAHLNYQTTWEDMWLRKAAAWMVMWSEATN